MYVCVGKGNGNPLQYSCLGNPMDGGAWWAAVHGVTKSQTQLGARTALLARPFRVLLVGSEGIHWPQFIMSCLGACARGLLTFILSI